jgi:hypothetical protein
VVIGRERDLGVTGGVIMRSDWRPCDVLEMLVMDDVFGINMDLFVASLVILAMLPSGVTGGRGETVLVSS